MPFVQIVSRFAHTSADVKRTMWIGMTRGLRLHRCFVAGTIGLVTGLALAPSAGGTRAPTIAEREAIVAALPASIRNTPVECLWLRIVVSSRDPRYALADGVYLNARQRRSRCVRYARNGFEILKRTARGWRIVFSGSDLPRCSLRVPTDLIRCRR
jgi:hypothetical protein